MATAQQLPHPRTLAGAAFIGIRDAVLSGELAPGSKINQNGFAEKLGVSLVPIREALQRLEAEGLVRIVPHRGAFVSSISRGEMEDLYDVREVLEGMATKHAVLKLRDEDLVQLNSLVSCMERETERSNVAGLLRLNYDFHFRIYQGSGRRFLCHLISGLWEKSALYRAAYVNLPGRSGQALREHKAILRTLQNREIRKAVSAIRNNIRQTSLGLLAALETESRDQRRGRKRSSIQSCSDLVTRIGAETLARDEIGDCT
jgi:DNA-binding GntR family transcriptional regulator